MKSGLFKYSTTAFLAIMVLAGCNSLNQAPTNKLTDETFWSSAERAELIMNMGYSQMYGFDWMWTDEALSDNMVETRGTPDNRVIRQSQATPSLGLFQSHWTDIFKGIKTCNIFLDKIDLVPDMDDATRDRMKAEMRTLRAMIYFRISNLWGDIPFFLYDLSLEDSYTMTRTPRSEVLATLHTELDESIPYLPRRQDLPAAQNGRLTKGAAVMLKARMYMYESDYTNAERYLAMLIDEQDTYGNYSLFTTPWIDPAGNEWSAYEAMFLSQNEYNSEVILDYQSVILTKEWGNLVSMVPRAAGSSYTSKVPTQSLVDSYIMLDGKTIAEATATGEYDDDDPYKGRDPRMSATVVYNGFEWKYQNISTGNYGIMIIDTESEYNQSSDNVTPTGYYVRKYYDPEARANYAQNNNIILMRYADVLLMYAEAYHENHGITQEVWNKTIRPIRERAGFSNTGALDFPQGLNSEEMRQLIRTERRCELALEGQRYWDIMRWNEGSELLNGIVCGAKFYNSNTEYIPVANNIFSERDKLWSLPQLEMDNVPTLRPNNPGY